MTKCCSNSHNAHPATDITLHAADVLNAARSVHALTYKGFGVLSANATSSMLMDYKAENPESYWQLVETLFGGPRPLMTTVKVEMGNDRNNSTGPNAATMRARNAKPNVLREPGFHLAADARRYQPGLHVSILRWNAPTWVHSNDDVYRWYKNTILTAYRTFGFMVNSVNPDVNERTPDLEWVAEFSRRVCEDDSGYVAAYDGDPDAGWSSSEERERFHHIRVITSDEETTGSFGPALLADARLREAIDIAAYHYSSVDDEQGSFTQLADEYDMEIWNSEAQAVFSNSADRPNNTNDDGLGDHKTDGTGIGGPGSPLEMANTLIKQFVTSRRTLTIYQPAIGANHEHMEYAAKELVSAHDPWNGWIYYDAGCAVLAHFARCAHLGWAGACADAGVNAGTRAGTGTDTDVCQHDNQRDTIWRAIPQASGCEVGGINPVNGARHGEPSYMTLAAPDGSDFSTIIVNDSAIPATYRLTVDTAMPAAGKPLNVWQTSAGPRGSKYDAGWMRHTGSVTPQPLSTLHTTPTAQPVTHSESVMQSEPVKQPALTVQQEHLEQTPQSDQTLQFESTVQSGYGAQSEQTTQLSQSAQSEHTTQSAQVTQPETQSEEYVYTLTVEPWSMITATTLTDVEPFRSPAVDENARTVLDVDPEHGVLYRDDFRYDSEPSVSVSCADGVRDMPYREARGGDDGAVPRYTTDSNGAFEVVPDAERGHVLRQQINRRLAGTAWIEGEPRTVIGDMRWTSYRVSVDVLFEPYDGRAPYVLLGAREMGGNKFTTDLAAYDFKLQADGLWLLRRYGEERVRGHAEDLRRAAVAAGTKPFPAVAGSPTVSMPCKAGDALTAENNAHSDGNTSKSCVAKNRTEKNLAAGNRSVQKESAMAESSTAQSDSDGQRSRVEQKNYGAQKSGENTTCVGAGEWFTLSLEVAGGEITASVNGAVVARLHDDTPQTAGRVCLGTSFDNVRFSNLLIERVPGYSPYYTALIDDMHLVRWADMSTPVLEYSGDWSHHNGQGMFTYLRTISTTSRPGASLSHTFDGTGLDLFGPSNGQTTVDVVVDGETVKAQESLMPTGGSLRTMLHVGGLPNGRHTVAIRLVNGTLSVDAVGVGA